MRLDALFHVSFYATLALASACLALPSTYFLWWMPLFFAVVLGMIALAWRYEGLWALSESAANQIGVFIAVGAAGWILFQIPRSTEDLAAGGVNWPAGLLPHLAPLLMVLLVVKLFRPKQLPDYWVIQTMGLMMVALAAVLSDEFWFGPLVGFYFGCLIWSLILYYPVREQAIIATGIKASQAPLFGPSRASEPLPWRFAGLPCAAYWTALVFLMGFALFLTAPRQTQSQWNPRQLSNFSATGYKPTFQASIDLNRTGYVELSQAPAFSVSIEDNAGRTVDPFKIKRWRQEVLEIYSIGRWFPFTHFKASSFRQQVNAQLIMPDDRPLSAAEGEWLVTFRIKPGDAGGLVLAEPLQLEPSRIGAPRVSDRRYGAGIIAILDGCDTFVSSVPIEMRRTFTYQQLVPASGDDLFTPARDVSEHYVAFLTSQRAPRGLDQWTINLLQEMTGLNDADRRLHEGRLEPRAHAKVAQALCRRLAHSADYRYSLDLRRSQPQLDPTVDFLMNVKEGHCERFAGGLALMLRSLNVPCRVVKGYLGADTDEDGNGIVRHNQAHTWVQVLVEGDRPGAWQWLLLDPTPSLGVDEGNLSAWWRWVRENLFDTKGLWRQFVMDYTPDQQAEFLNSLWRATVTKRGAITLTMLVGAMIVLLGRRRLRRWLTAARSRMRAGTGAAPRVTYYEEFLRLMFRGSGLTPGPGQTPREFAVEAAAWLRAHRHDGELARIPERIVGSYYLERFAGRSASEPDRADVASMLAALSGGLLSAQA